MTPTPTVNFPGLTPADTTPTATTSTTSSTTDPLGDESTFFQLLVAQLQNQDPTAPSDPTQMVTELAQFSQLEQSTQQTADLDSIVKLLTPPPTAAPTGSPAPTTS